MIIIEHEKVPEYAQVLQDIAKPISDRISSLFCLRTVGTEETVDALIKAFDLEPSSDLLKHEICYCLGQMNKRPENVAKIQGFFERILSEDHTKIVLHEAVEALGNVSEESTMQLLERFADEQDSILYETVYLTKRLIEWKLATESGKTECINLAKLRYTTNDPAPPYNFKREPKYADLTLLQQILLDHEKYDLFERYRALFTLREINTEEAVVAMCQCLTVENSRKCSALLKHEVAFVLAQMEDVFKPSLPFLLDCVSNDEEAPIVRHEILICIGMLIDDEAIISHFLKSPDLIVSQSCEVAINLMNYRKACEEQERKKREAEEQEDDEEDEEE